MADKISQFIPELWAEELLRTKEKNLVYGALANRNYEGMITDQGSRVRISQVGDIAINSYTKNSTSSLTVQFLSDAQLYLDIDQAKTFAFRVDDIDKAQTNIRFMEESMRKAGYKLNDTADQYIAGLHTQVGITLGTSSSPVDITSTNVEIQLLTLGEYLNSANAPMDGRFLVVPPWFLTKLELCGIRTVTDNKAMFDNGYIVRAYGFDIYMSNNVQKDSTAWANSRIFAGIKGESFTFAEQLLKMETYRMTSEGFGDVVKGLQVYGARVLAPDITGVLFADYTAES